MVNNNIFYVIPLVIIFVILFFIISISPSGLRDKITWNTSYLEWYEWQYHMDSLITDILSEENYEKVWINPEEYVRFWDFLAELKEYKKVDFDPLEENFVVWMRDDSWKLTYVPYRFKTEWYIFDNEVNKNLAILDIYDAYQKWLIYWGHNSSSNHIITFEKDLYHPMTSKLNEVLEVDIFNDDNNINKVIKELEDSSISKNQKDLLAYMYDLKWEYDKSEKLREDEEEKVKLNISWYVYDQLWNPITWAQVEILNFWKNIAETNDWKFEYSTETSPFTHIRLKAKYEWYSDWYVTVWVNQVDSPIDYKDITVNIFLNKADKTIAINNDNEDFYKKAKYYLLEMEGSKYFVPYDWLYYSDSLQKYNNRDITVYLYQFNRDTNTTNLLNSDTFWDVYWYLGNTMKTFWMPYIQIIDNVTWKELYTKSDNPVILQNKVYHMEELYNNTDELYGSITDQDLEYLVDYSNEEWWYPIDFDFLVWNNFLRWPARWTLDRERWVWENVWHRVVDVEGTVELPFYHIK